MKKLTAIIMSLFMLYTLAFSATATTSKIMFSLDTSFDVETRIATVSVKIDNLVEGLAIDEAIQGLESFLLNIKYDKDMFTPIIFSNEEYFSVENSYLTYVVEADPSVPGSEDVVHERSLTLSELGIDGSGEGSRIDLQNGTYDVVFTTDEPLKQEGILFQVQLEAYPYATGNTQIDLSVRGLVGNKYPHSVDMSNVECVGASVNVVAGNSLLFSLTNRGTVGDVTTIQVSLGNTDKAIGEDTGNNGLVSISLNIDYDKDAFDAEQVSGKYFDFTDALPEIEDSMGLDDTGGPVSTVETGIGRYVVFCIFDSNSYIKEDGVLFNIKLRKKPGTLDGFYPVKIFGSSAVSYYTDGDNEASRDLKWIENNGAFITVGNPTDPKLLVTLYQNSIEVKTINGTGYLTVDFLAANPSSIPNVFVCVVGEDDRLINSYLKPIKTENADSFLIVPTVLEKATKIKVVAMDEKLIPMRNFTFEPVLVNFTQEN